MTENTKRIFKQRDLDAPLNILTDSQVKALVALARYRYLSVQQMADCGVGKNPANIRNHTLYRLHKRTRDNLVQCQSYFATNIKFGRLPHIYALTKQGAEFVEGIKDLDSVRYPVGSIQYINDYFHRTTYVDFCIAVDKWADAHEDREVLSFSHYFDKSGANRKGQPMRSLNRVLASESVGEIEPDGLFFVDTGNKVRAFAVEIHNNTDTKRVIQQLAKHTHAINSGVISKRFDHNKASFVLSVAMTKEQSELIKKRFLTVPEFERFSNLFLFSDIETIKSVGFEMAFVHANGANAPIFS